MTSDEPSHIPVLQSELVEALITNTSGVYIDATFGRGGHTRALLERLDFDARVVVVDRDPAAIAVATRSSRTDSRVLVQHGNFGQLSTLDQVKQFDRVDGILFDVGVSTPQLKDGLRGFAFDIDGPLDMRMNPDTGQSAATFLNNAPTKEITRVLRDYGDVRPARAIAQDIVSSKPLTSTSQLVSLVKRHRAPKSAPLRLVSQVFQAVRIQVNDELAELEAGLKDGFCMLRVGGRLAIVTFHSLEHRLSREFVARVTSANAPRRMPVPASHLASARFVVKNMRPSDVERRHNPSARSAMLQVIERIR